MNPLTATGSQISWRGRAANIVDAAIGQALVSIEAASRNLSSSTAASSPKDRANAYDDILIASQDAVDATRRAIEELEKENKRLASELGQGETRWKKSEEELEELREGRGEAALAAEKAKDADRLVRLCRF